MPRFVAIPSLYWYNGTAEAYVHKHCHGVDIIRQCSRLKNIMMYERCAVLHNSTGSNVLANTLQLHIGMKVVLNSKRTEARVFREDVNVFTLSCDNEGGVLPLVAMWLMPLTAPDDISWEQLVRSKESTACMVLEDLKESA